MSIATELVDLSNNLQSAKTAVSAKGGTVGDTGLSGLASEIGSIPTGGGTITSYGTVTYIDTNTVEKTIEMVTEIDFLELTIGGVGTNIVINGATIDKSNIKSVTVGDGVQYLPNNFMYGCSGALTVNLPSSIHFVGSAVFIGCSVLNSALNLENVVYIGASFMNGCSAFNHPISLPKVNDIGSYFMQNCTSFNSAITINDDAEVIADRFMIGCSSFAQPFSIPSGLISTSAVSNNPGQRFMQNCNKFTGPLVCNSSVSSKFPTDNYTLSTTGASNPIYAIGVTLTGPYAQAWKTALPDRTSSPYRKLVVES